MKYLVKIILFISITTFFISCSDVLDETSPNDIDASNAINNASSANNALIGIYSTMRQTAYYGGEYLLLSEGMSKNATTGGFDDPNLDEIGEQNVTPSNTIIEGIWIGIYNTIANSNRLLEALSNISDLDASQKNHIEAQAITIRAMAHFDLLRYFGEHWDNASKYGIPIINSVPAITDIPNRASVAQNYEFIETELNTALSKINDESRDVAFINKATINGLLARVYLYDKKYPLAITHANEVINDGAYGLLPIADYASIFNNRQTSESIFELVFDSQNNSNYNSYTYSRDDALRTETIYLSGSELNAYFTNNPDDLRAGMLNYSTDDNDESITSDGSGRTQKYRGEKTKDNPAFILRFAEIHLIIAEAKGLTNGLADLNNFRMQRGLLAVNPTNNDEFINIILDEIRAEFNFEGHYYFNLARTGKIEERLAIEPYKAILPIPLREITASEGSIEQNPGY